jgi:outer membrane protein insertion porin family
LRRAIRGRKNDPYDGRLQKSTISYLQNLDIFKFINLQNEQRITDSTNFVDRTFYLTPADVRDVRLDFETNTRSGSYFGISTSANFTNRNWLGGAERLDLGISVGAETQLGGVSQFINTFEVKAEASLSVPKLFVPFKTDALYRNYVARTRFQLSNAYQIRAGFFTTNRLSAEMTYDWRANRMLHYQFSPISIGFNRTFSIDPDFQAELADNRRLEESLKNFVMLGGEYQMTYSSENLKEKKPYFFFHGNLKIVGNMPYATATLVSKKEEPYQFLGTPFSQLAKITLDARYYRPRRKQSWAFRFNSGLAVPYGNSEVVPYAEQFFIGGSTSLRAFRLRQLGPGSFVNPDIDDLDFFDQTGDIKLELNAEYRFDLAAYFKGAVFVDAGNIWLLNETIGELNQGRFQFNSFLEELAVGTGLGLRLDVSYFVIRLDAAFPLRKPVFDQGFQWTFSDINPLSKEWRSENLVWHLAIGYPF